MAQLPPARREAAKRGSPTSRSASRSWRRSSTRRPASRPRPARVPPASRLSRAVVARRVLSASRARIPGASLLFAALLLLLLLLFLLSLSLSLILLSLFFFLCWISPSLCLSGAGNRPRGRRTCKVVGEEAAFARETRGRRPGTGSQSRATSRPAITRVTSSKPSNT